MTNEKANLTSSSKSGPKLSRPMPTVADFVAYGVPERFAFAMLNQLTKSESCPRYNEWLEFCISTAYKIHGNSIPEKGFIVYGPPGLGKTHGLMALARCAIKHRWSRRGFINRSNDPCDATFSARDRGPYAGIVLWRDFILKCDRYRKTMNASEYDDPTIEVETADLIFIDDFSVKVTDGVIDIPATWQVDIAARIADILYRRAPHRFALFVTSNNTPQEMIDAWGKFTIDRLRALTEGFAIHGKSYR